MFDFVSSKKKEKKSIKSMLKFPKSNAIEEKLVNIENIRRKSCSCIECGGKYSKKYEKLLSFMSNNYAFLQIKRAKPLLIDFSFLKKDGMKKSKEKGEKNLAETRGLLFYSFFSKHINNEGTNLLTARMSNEDLKKKKIKPPTPKNQTKSLKRNNSIQIGNSNQIRHGNFNSQNEFLVEFNENNDGKEPKVEKKDQFFSLLNVFNKTLEKDV